MVKITRWSYKGGGLRRVFTVVLVSAFLLLIEKFPQFDWLRAVVFQLNSKICTCENYKPFAGSSINK